MASSNPVRRSTRKRPRARYTLDPFEGVEGIQDLSDITLSDEVGLGNDAVDTASDDDDFAMGDAGEIEEASVNDNLENQDDDVSCEDPETEPEGTAPSSSKRGRGGKQKNLERKKKEGIPRTLHRSAIIPHRYFNKQEWYIAMWGSRPEELIHLIRGRDKWCNDVTLPRREANERGEGGLAHSFFHTGELRAKEAKEDWEWYDCQEGREEFSNRQESRDLEAVEGIRYLPQPADWLSSSHVAVGCANGFVGVWDISRHLRPSSAPVPAEPRPFFYHLLHQTYILDITSCYPSHPDMIATSAMDGFVRLTSIRAPDTDMVWAPRSRVGPAVLAWDDAVQCVLAAEDNGTIRAFMRRRFFKGLAVARPAAMVTSLSAGTGHPSMMAGTVDGVVMVSNPLRRVLRDRNRTRGLQQTWFTHTYSRKGGGISRFTEGFALEVPYLHSTTEGEAKIDRASDGRLLLTIHEERTAVSQVSWNPNVEVGGWAAAGMASGLVRIADLAL
ncbi:MAG: hypothetical protein M1832_001211 [Thelocarpon impressellum]|nr:MAG: hypothetical protein M1832_001211 [Thelocarpon impressellum]